METDWESQKTLRSFYRLGSLTIFMVKEYSYEWKEPYAVNKLGRTILVLKTREDISAETI